MNYLVHFWGFFLVVSTEKRDEISLLMSDSATCIYGMLLFICMKHVLNITIF